MSRNHAEAAPDSRYTRHRSLLSDAAWRRISELQVLVAGVGGLGSNVLQILTRLAPVSLELWDPGVLDEPDLNRQILYRPADLGRRKIELAAREVAAINPDVSVHVHAEAITPESFVAAHGSATAPERPLPDVIMDCLDSFQARAGLEAIRREYRIPVIHGGIEGWYGQVCLFPAEGRGYASVYGPDYGSLPPAGKPMMPHVVTTVAALEVGLLIDWVEAAGDAAGLNGMYVFDGRSRSMDRIELASGLGEDSDGSDREDG